MGRLTASESTPARRRPPLVGTVAWLALLGALGGVGILALGACGLSWPGGDRPLLRFCAEPAEAATQPHTLLAERARMHDLQRRLDRLTLALLDAPHCPDPPRSITADPRPPDLPIVVADVPPGSDTPAVPMTPVDPAVGTPPDPAVRPEGANAESEEEIPQEDWEDRDVSFLEGCWTLITNYSITRTDTGQVFDTQDWEMCFDGSGLGRQRLSFDDGNMTCSGMVRAQFGPDDTLTLIDRGNVPCDNGSAIDQRILTCERLPDGTADCDTQHTSPPFYPVPVRFQR